MHEQTRQLCEIGITSGTLEAFDLLSVAILVYQWPQILFLKQFFMHPIVHDVLFPLEAHGSRFTEIVDIDTRGAGAGLQVDDHTAVGNEFSCAAVAFVIGRAVCEFVLCKYQKAL